jgi:predicted MPP superfamily phosphohydrolase
MFGIVLISLCSVLQVYVFWRAGSAPFLNRYVGTKTLAVAGVVLWLIFVLGRVFGHGGTGIVCATLEFLGMTWMGILLLMFVSILAVDLITLFGLIMPRIALRLRGVALLVGLALSAIALFQGLRPPMVEKYEVTLQGLPTGLDGTVLVGLSDLHLGSLIGDGWLKARIRQIKAMNPDMVVFLGDVFEGHGPPAAPLLSTFQELTAPLGVWAVPGNHESHGDGNMALFQSAGYKLLRNRWAEVGPGLVLAGVEDLTHLNRRGMGGDPVAQALEGRPPLATILLSHTPWEAEKAAEAGVGLMLCGHTHGGQIWPFGYLVKIRYPLFEGRYEIGPMTVIVCRGTGTWGPRMRLWLPGEILCVTLRSKNGKLGSLSTIRKVEGSTGISIERLKSELLTSHGSLKH